MVIVRRVSPRKEPPPALNLHIEPKNPIELEDMLASLATLGKRFQTYARTELGAFERNPRLFVSSIKPGSIDISLIPDLYDAGRAAAGAAVAVGAGDAVAAVKGFAETIKILLDTFGKPVGKQPGDAISVRDCDDAVNIVKPIAASGGTQTINVNNVQGDQIIQFEINGPEAERILENALARKALLLLPEVEKKEAVALVWQKVDKSTGRTEGASSPDKGRIEEIDGAPRSILFADDMAHVKFDMMAEPMLQMVYYVDVEIVRVGDKIKAYRVVGYHGKERLDD